VHRGCTLRPLREVQHPYIHAVHGPQVHLEGVSLTRAACRSCASRKLFQRWTSVRGEQTRGAGRTACPWSLPGVFVSAGQDIRGVRRGHTGAHLDTPRDTGIRENLGQCAGVMVGK